MLMTMKIPPNIKEIDMGFMTFVLSFESANGIYNIRFSFLYLKIPSFTRILVKIVPSFSWWEGLSDYSSFLFDVV